MKIKIYSTPTCHYCSLAKMYFQDHNLPYEEINVASDAEARKEMIELSGQMGVPVIVIGKVVLVGFKQQDIEAALSL